MTLDNPIILFGSGRNGSSALQERLSRHPNIAWISDSFFTRKPYHLEHSRFLMHAIDLPYVGEKIRRRYPPGECYQLWESFSFAFRRPCRDLTAEDVTLADKRSISTEFARLISRQRNRLLLKITGWPRIGYLNEIFPRSHFIHLVRDGRAAAYSLLKIDWWWGWQGPQNWRFGVLSPEDQAIWEKHGKSFIALAGLQWNILCAAAEKAIGLLPAESAVEIRYEDLCADTISGVQNLLKFVGMDLPDSLQNHLERHPFISQNEKWRTELTTRQQDILTEVTGLYLEKYHYI